MTRAIIGKTAQRVLSSAGQQTSWANTAARTGLVSSPSAPRIIAPAAGSGSAAAAIRALSTPSQPLSLPRATSSLLNTAAVAPEVTDSDKESQQGLLSSLLHGSEKAKKEGLTMSHSSAVSRGKFVHEIIRHEVKPDCTAAYKAVLAEYYPKIAKDSRFALRHVGSWEVFIGDLDTFFHIWEYDGYQGYDQCESAYHESDIQRELYDKVRPFLRGRSSWLSQEFSFWPTSPPHDTNGGIYELRTYHLKPGHLLEWAQHWQRGLEARRKFVEPVGAWFAQIGGLHTVVHLWSYPNLAARKETRDAAWQVATWNDTVSQTVKLIDKMHAQIMRPLPFSPLH
ncbi:unnamed protein product [Tilletia controversa]|uniref:NIPSNAP domain-containing protein n=3 Tax=Tilletia TaxID=13289 RepID=A0A8X7SYI8_9BASI|nr:hypothetical protein CF336_g5846 [Tilletia laevis]KAE8202735.1 hypothetical protein CF328_g2040 [Tilletia controversa]KAE8252264.1 hypothetical protein A4X03_0g6213 [Tilletia caries]KAE8202340.1 hypothetical protein CF335_g3455 [Tilletia laevis]KAE8251998.1 hypothetical protein A4X06_0g2452 [Tilletia controversa]